MGEAVRPGRRASGPGALPPKKGSFWIVPLVGMGCVLIFILATMLRESPPGSVVSEPPAEAMGRWVTSDPRYVDRGLRIGGRDIVLEVGPEQPLQRGAIQVVSTWQEAQGTVVHIEYDTGEGTMILEMVLEGSDRMRLRNPPDVVWTRVR